jgi:hypothetical protein
MNASRVQDSRYMMQDACKKFINLPMMNPAL